jgi:hypothetical protein
MYNYSFILCRKNFSDNLRCLYLCKNVTVQSNMLLRIMNHHNKINSM